MVYPDGLSGETKDSQKTLNDKAKERVFAYLKHYNYVDVNAEPGEQFKGGLLAFQKEAEIEETGEYDQETADKMKEHRCGVPTAREKIKRWDEIAEYSLGPTRWNRTHLTYRFDNFCLELSQSDCKRTIKEAFAKWSAVSRLTFEERPSTEHVDIRIGWYYGRHGDRYPFDGDDAVTSEGFVNVLAHAFFPPPNSGQLAGDVHFDEAEDWTVPLLGNVALHEIGHSLGLGHSSDPNAVMYYRANGQRTLQQDDINGIQALYP
ncbi:hypothetical protein H2198_004399 [Neophaeococcomyces mojaviensis]|uniref:Uncharacterized protein n=1 Tax=Neophaeococcomyces mojaviensis TaxID=3383035 RepID=A0ACC3A8W8_9EURO|nr:hypothetical protein H2198_004399 [Knufia sp. JES_112]